MPDRKLWVPKLSGSEKQKIVDFVRPRFDTLVSETIPGWAGKPVPEHTDMAFGRMSVKVNTAKRLSKKELRYHFDALGIFDKKDVEDFIAYYATFPKMIENKNYLVNLLLLKFFIYIIHGISGLRIAEILGRKAHDLEKWNMATLSNETIAYVTRQLLDEILPSFESEEDAIVKRVRAFRKQFPQT